MQNESAPCYGDLFGHNFPYTGSNCLACGVSQREISGFSPSATPLKEMGLSSALIGARANLTRRPTKGIHSEIHTLVADVRRNFGEVATKGKGSFGFYLGFFNRLGIERVRLFLAETRDGNNPKILFWWRVGKYFKEKKNKQL